MTTFGLDPFAMRAIAAVLALLLVGACAAPPPPAPPPPVAAPLLDADAVCLKELRERLVTFEAMPAYGSGACTVVNPVKVAADHQAGWNRPAVLSCAMARTVDRFETEVVQPLAQRHFGQAVARLHHMGTYDCRKQRTDGKAATAGRLSEHGKGQAIDVGGFELADGTVVSVKSDWHGKGARSAFLHAVAQASCERFNVVLTPNHDRLHQDHLHLDIGPHRLCGY